jgi:hypothetical protein
MVDPDLELTPTERSDLAMMFQSKGWQVVMKLFRIIVEQFRVDLDNADHANPKDVLAKHALSRAAGSVVTIIIHRITQEVAILQEARSRQGTPDNPQDSAPGLSMDAVEQAVEDLPNLLGDVTYIAEEDDDER